MICAKNMMTMTMSNEPEYFYKPGAGWVLGTPYETLEYDKGDGWWLICENRPRRDGETSWSEGVFKSTARALGSMTWSVRMLQGKLDEPRDHGNERRGGTCVFRLEKR